VSRVQGKGRVGQKASGKGSMRMVGWRETCVNTHGGTHPWRHPFIFSAVLVRRRHVINELQGEGEVAPRMYEDLGDYNSIKPLFEEVMTNFYNRKRKPMNLVFFEDALEHLTRIHRTLRLPQVGRGGAG
jgi:hypothetical protein